MGNEHTKPEIRLKTIDTELNKLNLKLNSTRRMSKDERERTLESLIKYSSIVNSFKGKVKDKELESTQRKISNTIQEIYDQSSRDSQLDLNAVETNSIIQLPITKKPIGKNSTDKVANKQKTFQDSSQLRQSLPTLKDIEDKLQSLCPLIDSAIANKDITQLRVHQQTLKVLATDLEMIEVSDETPLGDKKKKIDSKVTSYYQKITKSMKEIRRGKDINYLAKQTKKEKIMEELQGIKKELDECDEFLKKAQENGADDAFKTIEQNLVKINQKLSSVEVIDSNTRNLKTQLIDKRIWLQKYLENATINKQSELTKAQSNYENLIKNIASGENKDKDDTKIKLQSLQSFISTIESEDDNSLKRKQTLLNNINESLLSISDDKPDSSKIYFNSKLIENFISSWKKLQSELKIVDLSKDEAKHLENVLYSIQNSIHKTRKMLLSFYDTRTNIKSSLNVSAPNLCATSTPKQIYASSLSVDRLEPIKAKAKIYELGNGQVRSIKEEKAQLKQRQQDKRFSEIDDIRTQVEYIKEKYEKSNHKPHLKHKLEKYANILEDYIKDQDKLTANNAKILLDDIRQVLKSLEKKPSNMENVTESINKIQESVDQLEKRIHDFHGNKYDEECKEIKQILTNNKDNLISIKVSSEFNIINDRKRDIMNKIEDLLESLDMKVNNTFYEEAFVLKAWKNLNSLKEKVNRFTGAYKGVLYNQLEKDLNRLLIDTSENIKDKTVADEIIKDTEKYLQILEHRATKNQSFRHTLTATAAEDEIKMNNLKQDLKNIKKIIDTTPLNAVNSFIELNSRLDLVKLGLDQLKQLNENAEHQKAILENEVETLKNVVDSKIVLGQQSFRPWSIEDRRKMEEQNKKASKELDKIEDKLNELKDQIQYFIGTKSDKKFYELDESAIRLTIKMDDIELPKGSDLYHRKVNLLKEVHRFEEILDLKAKETENLIQFESDIKDIENNFEHYINSTKELENLAERVKFLQSSLESSDINEQLIQRKKLCIEKMKKMLDKIKQTVHEKNLNEEKLSNLTLSLETLRRKIQSDIVIDDNVLEKINNDLKYIKLSLDSLKNLNSLNNQHREELYQEVEILNDLAVTKQQLVKQQLRGNQENERNKADLDKIEQIMKTVKNEVNDFVGSPVDSKFCELDEILNRYIAKIDIMKVNKDSTLLKRKHKLLEELHNYSERLLKRAKDTEEIIKCEQNIKEIERNSRTFNTDHGLEKIQEVKEKLKKLNVDAKLESRKSACLQKLEDLSKRIKDSSFLEVSLQLANIEKTLDKLKDNIDNFQGIHSDKQYSVLTNNLNMLSTELNNLHLSSDSELSQKRNKFLEVIETYTNILKKKTEENQAYQNITSKLKEIADKLNKGQNIDSLGSDLKSIQAEIEHSKIPAKLKNDAHKRCIVLLEKYSQKMKNKSNTEEEIQTVEKKINELKEQIEAFPGDEQTQQYKTLEDELLQLNIKLKKFLKDPEQGVKKQSLKQKLVDCFTSLDDRIQQFETLSDIEKVVEELNKKIEGKTLNEVDKNSLDERLITLQVQLGKLQVGKVLAQRKDKVTRRIMDLMKTLKDKISHSESDDDDGGTSV